MKKSKTEASEKKLTDVEKAGLKGPVKEVKQIAYKALRKSGQVEKGKVAANDYHRDKNIMSFYNEQGRKTEDRAYYSGGWYQKVTYNEMGLPIEEASYHADGRRMQDTTKKYDVLGRIVEQIHHDAGGNIVYKLVQEYNKSGLLTFNCNTNFQGVITMKTIIKYTDDDKILEYTYLDNNGVLTEHKYTYDDKGNNTETCSYRAGNLISKLTTQYKYDENGIKTEYTREHFIAEKNATTKSFFKCNHRGDDIEVYHYNADGSLQSSHTITPEYDKDGNLIKPVYTSHDDEEAPLKSETAEMENDKHGNWIKKITYYTTSDSAHDKTPVHIYFREITYYGEEPATVQTPEQFFADVTASRAEKADREDREEAEVKKTELTTQQLTWMAEGSSINDPFPIFRYYTLTNNKMPSIIHYSGPYIEAYALLDELKESLNAKVIFSQNSKWHNQGETLSKYIVSFPGHPEYLLHAYQVSSQNSNEFEIPAFFKNKYYYDDYGLVYFSPIHIYRPDDDTRLDEYGEDDDFSRELNDCIKKCMLKKKPDKPMINMIEVAGNSFTMVEHAVDDDFEIKDLNVNYGYGFEKFHNELMHRFNTSTKGLVLFHGQPGTGKTYYIRHLLRKMASGKKVVIYMPPNMVDHLVEPGFMTFLSNEVRDWSSEGNFCVLLIEDAEPLLAKRVEGVRIQGITNLLNMTDGLLNDMLNLQIICTFNVDLRKLDSALLRPGRLVARKEFKALSELDANLLAQRLGIKHHFTRPATLGEIYAMRKNSNTLIHDVEPDKNASTNIDDLL